MTTSIHKMVGGAVEAPVRVEMGPYNRAKHLKLGGPFRPLKGQKRGPYLGLKAYSVGFLFGPRGLNLQIFFPAIFLVSKGFFA